MDFGIDIRMVLTVGYYVVAITTVIFVILDNRPPLKTLSWILVLLFLPLIGLIFYFYFGHNFKKERLFEGKKQRDIKRIKRITKEQSLSFHSDNKLLGDASSKWKVVQLLLHNNRSRLSLNNRLTILNNGIETFHSILDALEKAKNHIHIEYYIFEEGHIAGKIKDILIQKAREGVEIRFIYDSVGSWDLSSSYLEDLENAGVQICEFMEVRFPSLTSKINYRNHRKIFVIDGETGFLGGINISDKYLSIDPELGIPWRDTHLKVEGDCVNDLQLIFLTDWHFLTDESIKDEGQYFPPVSIKSNLAVQILASGPDTDFHGIMKAYFSAINSAEKSVHIVSPYFIPNESVLTSLKTVAASGIKVKIILPGVSDSKIVQFSSQSFFEDLMETGVEIYLYQTGFIHSKILIVDEILCSIGTANMDFRSFEQNMEVNAMVYDKSFASALNTQFIADLRNSKKINLKDWQSRSRSRKIAESFSRLFAPLL